MSAPRDADILIAGGGLAGGLLAWRLCERRPDLSVLLVESGAAPGGNHTWSFHDGDLSPAERAWIEPFVVWSWPSYCVNFPGRRREMSTGYASVTSERFAALLCARLGDRPGGRLVTGVPVVSLSAREARLADGTTLRAGAVIDARGGRASPHLRLGFQKFLGQEWEFDRPHGVSKPIVMDAGVPQRDGYRFVYVLPFTPTRLLVEDTYYADGVALDRERLRRSLADYAARAGWGPGRLVREEDGVLPIALDGDIDRHLAEGEGAPAVGLSAALFHPTTGYSLPDAVRVADLVAACDDHCAPALSRLLRAHARRTWEERSFFRLLNRFLFEAGPAAERYKILRHFYRLPDGLVSRFYAARLTRLDKARILVGKPPVSVAGALRVLAARGEPLARGHAA